MDRGLEDVRGEVLAELLEMRTGEGSLEANTLEEGANPDAELSMLACSAEMTEGTRLIGST